MWILITIALIGMTIMIFLSAPTSSDGLSGPAVASIWGYGTMAISVLGIIFTKIGDKLKTEPLRDGESIKWMLFTVPAFLMLFVLIFIITTTGHYYKSVNKGEVSEDYYKYSSIATMTISTQYLLLVYYMLDNDNSIKLTARDRAIATYLNYLFASGNIIIIIMLTIVAKYFITDG